MTPLTLEAETWWLTNADEVRPENGLVFVDMVKHLGAKFQFAQVPQALPGPQSGAEFREGSASIDGRKIAIKALTVYNDGLHIHVYSSTDDSDAILLLVQEALLELGGRRPITPPRQYNVSLISFEFACGIDHLISGFESLVSFISDRLFGKGELHPFSIAISGEQKKDRTQPTLFRIERRAGIDWEQNHYFSLANATTSSHLEILAKIETLAAPQIIPGGLH